MTQITAEHKNRFSAVQFSSVQFKMVSTRSARLSGVSPSVAFETVPMLV